MTSEDYEMTSMNSKNIKTKPRIKKPPLRIEYQYPAKPTH